MEFKVEQLTDPEEIELCHSNNFESWGYGLKREPYLGREGMFREQPINQNGNQIFWGLKKRWKSSGNWDIVASMESIYLPALVKEKGSQIRGTHCYVIMSVHTPPEHRRNGYASKLMKMGMEAIDQLDRDGRGSDTSIFSVLWSDVGDFYNKSGFLYSASDDELVLTIDHTKGLCHVPNNAQYTELADFDRLAKADERLIREIMERDTESDGVPRFAIRPTAAIYKSGANRSNYTVYHFPNLVAPFVELGAEYNGSTMTWFHHWEYDGPRLDSNKVNIPLSKRPEEALADFKALLQAMVNHAQRHHMPTVHIWCQDFPEQLSGCRDKLEALVADQCGVLNSEIKSRGFSKPMARFSQKYAGSIWVSEGRYACF